MQRPATSKDWLRLLSGSTLIAIGVAGIFLPIVPGIILILAGLATVAPESPRIQEWFTVGKYRLSGRSLANRWYRPDEAGEPDPGEAPA